MLKRDDNPPIRWPDDAAMDAWPGRWCVAHCKPRQEKALAWDIRRSGGRYFLPMYDKKMRSRSRQWTSRVVLFAGYLFLCGIESDRLAALQTGRVVRTLAVPDQPRLVQELLGIERMLASRMAIGPVARLVRGSPCRIVAGPLAGLDGIVERRTGRSRFVLMVSMLGQGAAVDVDADSLEPL